jgi:hypothetical protein
MEALQRLHNRGSISTGYDIDNSCKFEDANDEYLTRTNASGTNDKTFTVSFWFKRTKLGGVQELWDGGVHSEAVRIGFGLSSDELWLDIGKSAQYRSSTTQQFRDTSAWYHIVWKVDTTQSTEADRFRVYVNGAEITDWASRQYPPQNFETAVYSGTLARIGSYDATYHGSSGYMAEFNYLDGLAVAPTEFGEYDDDSGIWKPKEYTGSYPGQSAYLDFKDGANLGANAKGDDANWTEVNLAAADQATDTPTNNFCTFNANNMYGNTASLAEGATFTASTANGAFTTYGTMAPSAGKWWWEGKIQVFTSGSNVYACIGATTNLAGLPSVSAQLSGGHVIKLATNQKWVLNSTGYTYGTAYADADIINVGLDLDNRKFYTYKNGTIDDANGIDISSTTFDGFGSQWMPLVITYGSGGASSYEINFGGYRTYSISSAASDADGYGTFEYAPPSGYYALCTKNLEEYG